MKRGRFHQLVLLLAGVGALGSCAVLEIDVDVYKGPLANNDQVQVEQLAARQGEPEVASPFRERSRAAGKRRPG